MKSREEKDIIIIITRTIRLPNNRVVRALVPVAVVLSARQLVEYQVISNFKHLANDAVFISILLFVLPYFPFEHSGNQDAGRRLPTAFGAGSGHATPQMGVDGGGSMGGSSGHVTPQHIASSQ